MRVAPCHHRLPPKARNHAAKQAVLSSRDGAIDALKQIERVHHLSHESVGVLSWGKTEKKMVQNVDDAIGLQIDEKVVEVTFQAGDFLVLCFSDVVNPHMDFGVELRQAAGNLFADKELIRFVRMLVQKVDATRDGVVVSNCHQVHAAGPGEVIDRLRGGVAVHGFQWLDMVGLPAEVGMHMQICFKQ